MLNDGAYAASPTNTARSCTRQVRDDGFHTRAVRSEQERRRKIAMGLACFVLAVAAIFVMRATGDRDERVRPTVCTDIYDADICEWIE